MGDAARLSGLPTETLRYYDRAGLLGELPRTAGNHRVFDEQALGLLDVIVRLRRTNMPIEDVRRLADLVRAGDQDRPARLVLLQEHQTRVRQHLDELTADLAVIDWKIAAYTAADAGTAAPPPPPGWPRTTPDLPEGNLMTHTATMPARTLGRTGPTVSALGVGTWALGGPFSFDGRDAGWGPVDDAVSAGPAHRDRARRDADRHGPLLRDRTRRADRRAGAGRRRLGVDAIDLYQLHDGAQTAAEAEPVVAVLAELVAAGKVRHVGTSQDPAEVIDAFARSPHCVAVQSQVNVFGWSTEVMATARRHGLSVLARSPLAMGMLSGRYSAHRRPQPGDVRL